MISELFKLLFMQISSMISKEEAFEMLQTSLNKLKENPDSIELQNEVISSFAIFTTFITNTTNRDEVKDSVKKELIRLSDISNKLFAKKENLDLDQIIDQTLKGDLDIPIKIINSGNIGDEIEEDDCDCPFCVERREIQRKSGLN